MIAFAPFKKQVEIFRKEILREIIFSHAQAIKVKKEERVVSNLGKIFDATLSISNRKGFHAMSLRDLSAGSGLSMGALYSYFSSKDELMVMIQEQGQFLAIRVLDRMIDRDAPSQVRLENAITAHVYLSEAMQPWFYFSYMEAKNLDKSFQREAISGELATEKVFSDILRQGQNQGVFRKTDPDLTAGIIKAMLQDWYLKRWKYSSRKITVETYAGLVVEWVEAFVID